MLYLESLYGITIYLVTGKEEGGAKSERVNRGGDGKHRSIANRKIG